ncbi:MAG: thiolase family protein [Actinomycetota bacterium]|nr:thiolase family protein [Actinomycetota bacterium]MDD5668253.1 thiolase family protein [Actinomycetota bacterium]
MNEAYIVSGCRTAIGKYGGSLKDVKTGELVRIVIEEALKRANISPDEVDDVVFGQVVPRTDENCLAARLGALKAGIPDTVPASGVIRGCGSGMQAVIDAVRAIRLGDSGVAVAGGAENMSSIHYYSNDMRWGKRMRSGEFIDGLWEVLHDPYNGLVMGMTAENIAERYGVSREEQDAYALESQRRALAAIAAGKFKQEIVPVEMKTRKGTVVFDTDEHPTETTLEKLASLPPAFKKDGTVTAGNASGINDAAAALVLVSGEKVEELGVKPLARVLSYSYVGVDPEIMGVGPIYAVPKALEKAGLKLEDIGVIELNEAFAAQAFTCIRELGLDPEITNIYGSGVALGHPVGCTGARIVVTLMSAMRDLDVKTGLATLCIGGGQGTAIIIERV